LLYVCHYSQTARVHFTRFHISLSGNVCDDTVSLYIAIDTCHSQTAHARFTHFHISLSGNVCDDTMSLYITIDTCHSQTARAHLTRFHISLSGNVCDDTVSLYIAIDTCHSQTACARLTRFHISLLGNHCDTTVSLSNVLCVCHCSQTAHARLTRFQGYKQTRAFGTHALRVNAGRHPSGIRIPSRVPSACHVHNTGSRRGPPLHVLLGSDISCMHYKIV